MSEDFTEFIKRTKYVFVNRVESSIMVIYVLATKVVSYLVSE